MCASISELDRGTDLGFQSMAVFATYSEYFDCFHITHFNFHSITKEDIRKAPTNIGGLSPSS